MRSPFPKAMQADVRAAASAEYDQWLKNLTAKDREEVNQDELVGVFEMFLFSAALERTAEDDPDAALTLHHPFMPRIGDVVNDEAHGPSRVVERRVEKLEDDKPHMVIALENVASGASWESSFLLPP